MTLGLSGGIAGLVIAAATAIGQFQSGCLQCYPGLFPPMTIGAIIGAAGGIVVRFKEEAGGVLMILGVVEALQQPLTWSYFSGPLWAWSVSWILLVLGGLFSLRILIGPLLNRVGRISLKETSKILGLSGGLAGLILSVVANPFPTPSMPGCLSCYPAPVTTAIFGALMGVAGGIIVQFREDLGGLFMLVGGLVAIEGYFMWNYPFEPSWGWLISWVLIILVGGLMGVRNVVAAILREMGRWGPFVLGLTGAFWGGAQLAFFFIGLVEGGALGSPLPPFAGLLLVGMFLCGLGAFVGGVISIRFMRVGSVLLLASGNAMWPVQVLFLGASPGPQLPSEGIAYAIGFVAFSFWIFLVLGAGLLGIAISLRRRIIESPKVEPLKAP